MAGVHGGQHVKRLAATTFAHNDAVWPHAQRVAHQVANLNGAPAFKTGRTCFERYKVRVIELQLGGILDSNDSFTLGYAIRENIQQGGFAGARPAGHNDVLALLDTDGKKFAHE